MKTKHLLLFCLMLAGYYATAQVRADDIIGNWLTGGKEPAQIQVYKSGDKYFGKIVWLKFPEENGLPRTDGNNPEKSKRGRQILGLVILRDFRYDEYQWEGGRIYDPESGKTYSCILSLKDKNTLKVRGYVAISLLGRTETWTRTASQGLQLSDPAIFKSPKAILRLQSGQ